ncbi:diuretic hormone class 2-like [Parasteatoda tepidariorum]|uniref:diuretic hormone class 2-like n=1 Tax=Parasteatoda tepidariorum TaxID=114398 RepID=UPI00077F9719|nr:diuretic hormone class 2-like [Parasteatoda tepidariorum]
MNCSTSFRILFSLLVVMVCCFYTSQAQGSRNKRSIVEVDNPRETLQVLGNLAQRIIEAEGITNEKRGLDLGLSRGFSGSQAAKHLMGLSAASFANGPGRKRRFVDENQ